MDEKIIKDAEGNTLHEGDRVYTHDFNEKGKIVRVYGTLKPNEDHKEVSEWYVEYDDGMDCAVLNYNDIYKA